MLDILHTPNVLPSIKKNSQSYFSRGLFIIFIIVCLIIIIYRAVDYTNDFKINYTQDFQKTVGKINKKVTFGFRIQDNNNNSIKLEYFDSFNEAINDNIIKRCDSNLKEIKGNETRDDDFYCFIDYQIRGSNITNHIIKVHLKSNDKKSLGKRIPLIVKFIEPTIKHDEENPFDYSDLYEMKYFYDIGSATSYRKYIKVINYKSEGFFGTTDYDSAYLEDYEDLAKINSDENDAMIGSFRFSLSKKKDIFERKYVAWYDFILGVISNIISIMGAFSFISLIMVNPNDNLRIFYNLKSKKPSLSAPTSDLINEFWHKKNPDVPTDTKLNIPEKIGWKDKFKYFFSYYFCCDSCKKEEFQAIDDFITEKMVINDTLENLILEEKKYKLFKERIINTKIPDENRTSRNAIYQYLKPILQNDFPNYERDEIKIREIIAELYNLP